MTLRISTAAAAIAVAALTSAAPAAPIAGHVSKETIAKIGTARSPEIQTARAGTGLTGKARISKQDREKKRLRRMIAKHAKANGVPVDLAEAVVTVESSYNPRARGKAGEVGLMQIKPATARGIGYKGATKDLYDPETNLRWGMKYLGQAHKLGGGSVCGTILKYNAGHHAKRMNKISARYCNKVKRLLAES